MIRWTHLREKNNTIYELYDYENDPQERINIAKKNQDVINKMSEILEHYPEPKSMITSTFP